MSKASGGAVRNERAGANARDLVRFEVRGRDADRGLIRSIARLLAEDTPEASDLRAKVIRPAADEQGTQGGILAALRRSPMVGAELDLTRPSEDRSSLDL